LGRAAGDFFLTDWLAAVAAASEVGGQLRQDGIATARAFATHFGFGGAMLALFPKSRLPVFSLLFAFGEII
jgi:hypothetical protein